LTEVVGVKFKNTMKMYYFDPAGLEINTDQPVIVETSRGVEYAMCTMKNTMVEDDKIVTPLKKVIRIATAEDTKNVEENAKKEGRALEICKQKVLEHKLDMKFVGVEYSFDGSKIVFYFTADGRVDFRELVKDLASIFHTRIELRQIGVRDEAKLLGGLGICGRALCCSEFLDTFHPVSIKMARSRTFHLIPRRFPVRAEDLCVA